MITKRRLLITTIMISFLILCACSTNKSTEGVIVEKVYVEPSTSTTMITISSNNSTIFVPTETKIKEKFKLRIKRSDGKVKNVNVNKKVYDSLEVSDFYSETMN